MQVFKDEATGKPVKIVMRKPSDMHQHLRDEEMLKLVAPMVSKRFHNVLVMPNLTPPVTMAKTIDEYYQRIQGALGNPDCRLHMTFYFTDALEPQEVYNTIDNLDAVGVKYYPKGLTTNSDSGVNDPAALWTAGTKPYDVLRAIIAAEGVLLIHAADGFASQDCSIGGRKYSAGEVLDPYDQELHFISYTLDRIRQAHPELKVSVEHLSTSLGVEYMRKFGGTKLGCSLTAQHLLLDRRDSFSKGKSMGFNPHRFWWPIIQPKEHRDELRKFAAEGHDFVWLGSDSAPHPINKKEADCCTGGVLMAHAGIELYIEAFEDMNALDDRFERFACLNGPRFFGVTPSDGDKPTILVRDPWQVQSYFIGEYVAAGGYSPVIPFRLGETVRWKLAA